MGFVVGGFGDGAEAIHGHAGLAQFIRVKSDASLDLDGRLSKFTATDVINELLDFLP